VSFTWRDGERVIRLGRGAVADAVELLGGPGYTLLTTERMAAAAPHVVAAAGSVHHVGHGLVEDLAGDLLGEVSGDRLVALGGGRVVDVAKALAAVGGVRAMAVPTTLSGAEMTRGHRLPPSAGPATVRVRCAVVVNDPALSASQDLPALAASALNALGHAAEGPCTPFANPVSTLAGHEAARLLVGAFAPRGPDRDALALGALLGGYALDASAFGLHHVLAQTLVRVAGVDHAAANAVMLPHSLSALAWRFPRQHEALTAALGEDPAEAALRICALTGATRLAEVGVAAGMLAECAETAARRPELANTGPTADRPETRALYKQPF